MADVANEGTSALFSTMTQFSKIAPVINLGMMVAGFVHINNRLNQLSRDIEQLGASILAEFSRDRDTQFKVALEAVHDVFEGDDNTRHHAMRSAVDGLREARENFLKDFEAVLQGDITPQKIELAQYVLSYAMYAETTRIRCYVANNQHDLARKKMKESLPIFHEATQRFVKVCMGEHPALFLHKDFNNDYVERFFHIQGWLSTQAEEWTVPDMTMLDILHHIRQDFWNNDLISDKFGNIFQQIVNQPTISWKERVHRLVSQLNYAEAMIENYHRLQGFDLELRAQRLVSVEELVSEDELARHSMALIVDDDFLQQLTWQNLSKPPRQ
ncbi:MAG: hypothetical protein SFZ02_13805 [bacterium]|nr:hypothetical protein [bacterium]